MPWRIGFRRLYPLASGRAWLLVYSNKNCQNATVPLRQLADPRIATVHSHVRLMNGNRFRAIAKHRLISKIEAVSTDELDEICQAVSTILEIR
jgi:mRNA-degrading endonuclease toxin of MazEF toxin-antitoxin module